MRKTFSLVAVLWLAACAPASVGSAADPACEFPPGTGLAFSGRSTLGDLGLDALGPVESHDQVGTIYVTSERIEHPRVSGAGRVYCAVYGPDEEVAIVWGPAPTDWQVPSSPPS